MTHIPSSLSSLMSIWPSTHSISDSDCWPVVASFSDKWVISPFFSSDSSMTLFSSSSGEMDPPSLQIISTMKPMKKRRIMKENEGYSLIEMIIVIAIIAVMSAAAMVTISIIHNAKAKEAASTLEDALFEVQNNAKGKICVVNGTQEKAYRYYE